jgi:hypothetical protein
LLPFLKNRDKQTGGIAGMIIKTREPDEKPDTEQEDDREAGIKACAAQLISCIHAHDVQGAADALKDAFAILDSQPHTEGEHVEPHSYEASKD